MKDKPMGSKSKEIAPLWLPCLFGGHEFGEWVTYRGVTFKRCKHCGRTKRQEVIHENN